MQEDSEHKIFKAKLFVSMFSPILFVSVMIVVKLYENVSGHDLFYYGIEPRTFEGLRGILFSPFIHADWDHLFSNAVPMVLLGTAVIYFYRNVAYKMFFYLWLMDGIGVWVFGRYSYHIGASGLVYGLASFLFISGLIRKSRGLLAISFAVALLYGGIVWGILPQLVQLSWESHLFGLVSGMLLAVLFMHQGPLNDPLPEWYYDDELKRNLLNTPLESEQPEKPQDDSTTKSPQDSSPRIVYHFKKSPPSEGT